MPTFFIEQFGCRATQADGAALERQLLDRGCSAASTAAAADIVVVNTCTVTASADAQARDARRRHRLLRPARARRAGRTPRSGLGRWQFPQATNPPARRCTLDRGL